jgi:DNA polymerase-1
MGQGPWSLGDGNGALVGDAAVVTSPSSPSPSADGLRPLLVALDGDGLLHRAYHAMVDAPELWAERDPSGSPTWALRGLVTAVAVAAARLRPAAVLVALDCRLGLERKAAFAGYKAHRPPRESDLQEQLEAAPALLADAGIPYAVLRGQEGDDVLASAAALARRSGWDSVLVTSDRDVLGQVDATTRVLRVDAGGVEAGRLLTVARVRAEFGVPPQRYAELAALRGDPSDNLPGVPGIGSKTAARMIEAFGSAHAAFDAAVGADRARLEDVVGAASAARLATPDARTQFDRTLRLMALRDDLPLPDLAELLLPLDRDRLVAGLRSRGIRLGACLWALVGDDPPPWEPNGFDKPPRGLPVVARPVWTSRSVPTFADLAARRKTPERRADAAGPPTRPRRPRRPMAAMPGQMCLF